MKLMLVDDDGVSIWESSIKKDSLFNGQYNKYVCQLKSFMDILVESIKLFTDRHIEYGETWELSEFPDHELMLTALVSHTKSKRICNMLDKSDALKKHDIQIINNTLDIIVFSNFLLQQIQKHKNREQFESS